MSVPKKLADYHQQEAETAARLYVASLTSPQAAMDWHDANTRARGDVIRALRASGHLTNIQGALQKSGGYIRVLRHILAPPISQDQFNLLCPAYSKARENAGSPIAPIDAKEISATFMKARDRRITRWLDRGGKPSSIEVRHLLQAVAPLLSQQLVATVRRNRMSAEQEGAVIELLKKKGWSKKTSSLIQTLSDVPVKHYMHKTRFATKTQPQEVDVACGLGKTVVLAMECKVTNDQLNSVKRINDVLKKATAWQAHWGSFVHTAALLQGVIAPKDVNRLLEANVHVFWSHKLSDFSAWIAKNTKT